MYTLQLSIVLIAARVVVLITDLSAHVHVTPTVPFSAVNLLQLIRVNTPDLVLFVGEALVGNEAVDQLVKFNRALIDHADPSQAQQETQTIDGILLTKFDTIDDKVRAEKQALLETYNLSLWTTINKHWPAVAYPLSMQRDLACCKVLCICI